MKQPWEMTETERLPLWESLAGLLNMQPLPQQRGPARFANAAEFMMMHITPDGTIGFKHRDTRNYLFLIPDPNHSPACCHGGYELYVPMTSEPFMRGQFDKF